MDMNGLTQNNSVGQTAVQNQTAAENRTRESSTAGKKYVTAGRTIGNPQLSDKAMKYYEQLKKKYANMEFILVSPDKKEEAEQHAAGLKGNSLLVLIDSDKIEKMAEDEAYRKQYETILDNAGTQIAKISVSLGTESKKVRNFGMKFDDYGNASFFAVIDRSLAAQRDRITEKKLESTKEKKEAARKEARDRLKNQAGQTTGGSSEKSKEADTITVTAGSWEELLGRIQDVLWGDKADHILTEGEKKVGRSFDYSL